MIKHVYHRLEQYGKVYHINTPINKENSTDNNVDENTTDSNESFYETESWFEYEEIPVMSGKYI